MPKQTPKPPIQKPLLQKTTTSTKPHTHTSKKERKGKEKKRKFDCKFSETELSYYMRMSCNGCRVLRKGCSENCSIRPCLQWIKTSESQSNATLFLAKFYGRAGLLNLINAGPEHLRPSIFQSMLYEACGRIVNPIYGSVGLLWSGNWKLCQSAVEAILNGDPIKDISSEINTASSSSGNPNPPFKAYDIRHVFKDDKFLASSQQQQLHKAKTRNRFKRTAFKLTKPKPKPKPDSESAEACNLRWKQLYPPPPAAAAAEAEEEIKEEKLSHESSLSHQEADQESMVSVETGEGSVVNRIEMDRVPENRGGGDGDEEELLLNLNLTLGF